MSTKRTTVYLAAADRSALAAIQRQYGGASLSDALRLAIRTMPLHAQANGTPLGAAGSERSYPGEAAAPSEQDVKALLTEILYILKQEVQRKEAALAEAYAEIRVQHDELHRLAIIVAACWEQAGPCADPPCRGRLPDHLAALRAMLVSSPEALAHFPEGQQKSGSPVQERDGQQEPAAPSTFHRITV